MSCFPFISKNYHSVLPIPSISLKSSYKGQISLIRAREGVLTVKLTVFSLMVSLFVIWHLAMLNLHFFEKFSSLASMIRFSSDFTPIRITIPYFPLPLLLLYLYSNIDVPQFNLPSSFQSTYSSRMISLIPMPSTLLITSHINHQTVPCSRVQDHIFNWL